VTRNMNKWNAVRRHVLIEGNSKRSACDKYNIGWSVLTKMLKQAQPEPYKERRAPSRPKILEPFMAAVERMLEEDATAPVKQRHSAKRIFDRLRTEYTYPGGYTVVRDAIRLLRKRTKEVFIPLAHPPGEAQMDFGQAAFWLDGVQTVAHICELTLPYSGTIFMQAYPRECAESFFDGHVRAFEHFGGVPKRTSYDNSKIPVRGIIGAHERVLTESFKAFQSHHMFESHFCQVACPNEKGHVENSVGFGRRNAMVPMPRVKTWEELNAILRAWCEADLDRICRGKTKTKRELLEEDRRQFLPMPTAIYDTKLVVKTHARSTSLVRFDCNDYSVPTEWAHHEVTAIGSMDEVRICIKDEVVAVHRRLWLKEGESLDPLHYLVILEKKPGALDYGRPMQNFALPACFGILRQRLKNEEHKGLKEYIRVLKLLVKAPVHELSPVIEMALEKNLLSADAIRLMLEKSRETPVDFFCLDGHPHLRAYAVPKPDLTAYRSLIPSSSPPSICPLNFPGDFQ